MGRGKGVGGVCNVWCEGDSIFFRESTYSSKYWFSLNSLFLGISSGSIYVCLCIFIKSRSANICAVINFLSTIQNMSFWDNQSLNQAKRIQPKGV